MELSYAHGASATPLLGETIGDALDRVAAQFPDREALVSCHQDIRYTYAEYAAKANATARALLALAIQPGERVGIWSPNCAEWAVLQFATAKIGAILVTINPAYKTTELDYVLRHSGVRTLVHAAGFRSSDYVAMVAEVSQRLPKLEQRVVLADTARNGSITWSELATRSVEVTEDRLREVQGALQFDSPINIQYTSGTTGLPKGATLTHHNILNNAYFVGAGCDYSEHDRVCIPVPLYHCFGMVIGNLSCMAHGACAVYPAESFDAEATLRAVQEERCTSLYGVPTMFIAELEHPKFLEYELTSLRTGIMAGSPCPVEVMRRVINEMHMPEVTIGYGMTETSPVSFQTLVSDQLDLRVSTVGHIHPHVEAKVVDPESGAVLHCGLPGELCTRGYLVMPGYWDDEVQTRNAIDSVGWMHTGDLATLDENGYARIVGRLKDMVIRGGENIYPREIEEYLYAHPAIRDAQVIGVPDLKYGEELCAWVALKDDTTLSYEELREWLKARIAAFKVPRYWKFTPTFPMTVTGKIQKFKMREESIAELGLDAAAKVETA